MGFKKVKIFLAIFFLFFFAFLARGLVWAGEPEFPTPYPGFGTPKTEVKCSENGKPPCYKIWKIYVPEWMEGAPIGTTISGGIPGNGDKAREIAYYYRDWLLSHGFRSATEKEAEEEGWVLWDKYNPGPDACGRIGFTYYWHFYTEDKKGSATLGLSVSDAAKAKCPVPEEIAGYIVIEKEINASSLPVISKNYCQETPEEKAQRTEIKNRIKSKFGVEVVDTDICGKVCGLEYNYWSKEDILRIEKFLDTLPACFLKGSNFSGKIRNRTKNDKHKEECCETKTTEQGKTARVVASWDDQDGAITFCDHQWKKDEAGENKTDYLESFLMHELTHAWQYNGLPLPQTKKLDVYRTPRMKKFMQATGWKCKNLSIPLLAKCIPPKGRHLNNYAETNPKEDLAEAARYYYETPDKLKQFFPVRYNFVKEEVLCNQM